MFQKKDMPTTNMTMTVVGVSVDDKKVLLLYDTGNHCSVSEEICERKVHVTKQGEEVIAIAMDA